MFDEPSLDRYMCVVKRGNAMLPYELVTGAVFFTEFAARLFGFLTCQAADQYHYWMVKRCLA